MLRKPVTALTIEASCEQKVMAAVMRLVRLGLGVKTASLQILG